MNHIFSTRAAESAKALDPLGRVMQGLQDQVNGGSALQFTDPARSVTMEGFSDNVVRNELTTAVSNMEAMLQNALGMAPQIKAKLSVAQEEASIIAGIVGSSPKSIMAYMARDNSLATLNKFSSENTQVIGHGGMNGAADKRAIDMQAFDNRENSNAMVYSVAYNMQASRQDELGEAFFPTVVVPPNEVGFMMSIRVQYVYDAIARSVTGSLAKYNRKNVIKAVIDSTILRNDQTKIVPIYRNVGSGAVTDNATQFATDVGSISILNDGVTIATGALAIGKEVDLIGISQTDALLATGVMDQTDSIDSSIRLGSIYLMVPNSDATVKDVIKFDVSRYAGSDFNAPPQGNTQKMQLVFDTDSLYLTTSTKKIDGGTAANLSSFSTNTVRISTSVYGSVVQDTGAAVVNGGVVTVRTVKDTDGNTLSLASGAGAAIVTALAGAKIVGYDLIAYRTNANRRQRGQLIDTQFMNYLYTVPTLPPITAMRPVAGQDNNDSAMLAALITTTHVRTSNAAVSALFESASFIKQFAATNDSITDSPAILGVSRDLVTPAYLEETINVATTIDSLSTAQRTADLEALLQNKIRDMAIRMYVTSGYKAAADALHDNAAPKPCVIIGTDQTLSRYLTLTGDLRLMGEAFDYKLVYSLDSRMTGKIFIAFGTEQSFNSGVPNPMHFGNMAWKPEMTLMMPMTRGQSMTMELTVQPSFRHITNCPILGVLTVTNISAVVATKVAINNKVVT